MGFLSEIRKLLFAKKSVAKSAVNKGLDYTKEKGEEFSEVTKEMIKDASEGVKSKTSGLKDAIFEGTEDAVSGIKEKTGDAMRSVKEKVGDVVESISESEAVKKTAEFTEKVGDKVLDIGEDVFDKGKDVAEDLGEKVLDVKEDMVEKAKELGSKITEKLDETIEKAQKFEAEEAAKPKKEFSDSTLDASGSLLVEEDDFFSKASKYAEGEYSAFSEGQISISEAEVVKEETTSKSKAAGFEDLDGDGDEIIDDALIVIDSDQEE